MEEKLGFVSKKLLLVFFIVFLLLAGGIWLGQSQNSKQVLSEPLQKIIPSQFRKILPLPTLEPKLPWEDSVCGNGICEPCESHRECCNYPCSIDKNGVRYCPPPSCVGWCPPDCGEAIPTVEGSVTPAIFD